MAHGIGLIGIIMAASLVCGVLTSDIDIGWSGIITHAAVFVAAVALGSSLGYRSGYSDGRATRIFRKRKR